MQSPSVVQASPSASAPLHLDSSLSLRQAQHRTDIANGRRFANQFSDNTAYVGVWKKWLAFDGQKWRIDVYHQVETLAKRIARTLWREVGEMDVAGAQQEVIDDAIRFARRSSSSGGIASMLAMARSELPCRMEDLNQHPWLLNVSNGTLDLRHATLRPHDREDWLTQVADVNYDPQATCPIWVDFLQTIFEGKQALIDYMQQLIGMALTGDASTHILPILHGSGANGKSTLINAVFGLLGPDYSMKAPRNLLVKNNYEAHPTNLADLFGKRFVACVETERGSRLAETLVKELTGGDKIRARRMREDFWEFSPTHKIWLATNHKPEIRGTDHAIWRRVRLIPFDVEIATEKQDPHLSDKLLAERDGILTWAVQGCLNWQRNGLEEPDEVRVATDSYRGHMDVLAEFIAEECVTASGVSCGADELRKAFNVWSGTEMGRTAFRDEMEKRGYRSERGTKGAEKGRNVWLGITLRECGGEGGELPVHFPDSPRAGS